jgi:DNA-binding LacI/PurR family transcriptional regulator
MADVAARAGVSHQTVSRVLNGSAQVREATRERVLAAMRELDYRPNLAARTLVTGRSHMLGVVSFDTTLHGPATTLFGIERAAHEHGYAITVSSLAALERASLADAVERLRRQGVEGILVITPQDAGTLAIDELDVGAPIVAVEGGAPGTVPFVGLDNHGGAELATRHLLELGHRQIRHISGPPDWPEAQKRLEGWRAALVAAGLEPAPAQAGDWSPASGYRRGLEIAGDADLTAVFVANDQMALGLIRALHESGRPVPGEVSVVGFDDIPEAEFFIPPLTTVRQDFQAIGRSSVGLLLDAMTRGIVNGGAPAHVTIDPSLVLRRSTAALA